MNKKRILVVEDETSFRQVVKFKLNEAGYDVILAKNGIDGYESFTEDLPDMVITDLAMPEMTGLELIPANYDAIYKALVKKLHETDPLERAFEKLPEIQVE